MTDSMMITDTAQFVLFSLIMMRMAGFVLLNPILGRNSIPMIAKSGFILVLTLLLYSFSQGEVIEVESTLSYSLLLMKEFVIGYFLGFVMQLFSMVITFAASVIDFQMGISMAMVFDPMNNAQVPLSGSIYNVYYMLLFFAVDGHLAMMKILLTSADVVPYGAITFSRGAFWAMLDIFSECVVLAMKLAFPILAAEFIITMGMGILMKMIPQINVFVVQVQIKIIVGLALFLFLFSPMSDSISNLISNMLREMQGILQMFSGLSQ